MFIKNAKMLCCETDKSVWPSDIHPVSILAWELFYFSIIKCYARNECNLCPVRI
jgi:hypothetical protein